MICTCRQAKEGEREEKMTLLSCDSHVTRVYIILESNVSGKQLLAQAQAQAQAYLIFGFLVLLSILLFADGCWLVVSLLCCKNFSVSCGLIILLSWKWDEWSTDSAGLDRRKVGISLAVFSFCFQALATVSSPNRSCLLLMHHCCSCSTDFPASNCFMTSSKHVTYPTCLFRVLLVDDSRYNWDTALAAILNSWVTSWFSLCISCDVGGWAGGRSSSKLDSCSIFSLVYESLFPLFYVFFTGLIATSFPSRNQKRER